MRRSALLVTAAVCAMVLPSGLAGAAPDDAGPGESSGGLPATVSPPGPPRGDRDGDHVSDDFEGHLRSAASTERLRVIVTGIDSGQGRRAVGAFALRHELRLVHGFATSPEDPCPAPRRTRAVTTRRPTSPRSRMPGPTSA